jgi:rSAM/selenodomain-associated transferase 1
MKPPAILVLAKAPHPGKVKTRLLPALSPVEAAEIHRACLADTLRMVSQVKSAERWLLVAGSAGGARRLARQLGLGRSWRVAVQGRGDLGARLSRWFRQMAGREPRRVVAVGADSPWIGASLLRRALAVLARRDVVLGPARDGGYFLIGARRWMPNLFRGVSWGTGRVLQQTRRRLSRAGIQAGFLATDFDLDRPEDLRRAARLLRDQPQQAPALARALKQFRFLSVSSRRPRPAHPGRIRRPGLA